MNRKDREMYKERLIRERDALIRQRDAIENQIAGIEKAISLIGLEDGSVLVQPVGRKTGMKGVVLDLLKDSGTTGLNAVTAVELANLKGVTLERPSVSSLLSRLKKEGIVDFEGDRYRLKEFAKPKAAPSVVSQAWPPPRSA